MSTTAPRKRTNGKSNPYLDEFLRVMRPIGERQFARWVELPEYDILWCRDNGRPYKSAFVARSELCRRFAWAVPNAGALDTIAALGVPVVEIGAGTGYWASLLAALGVSICAFDEAPGRNRYCDHEPYTLVSPGDHRALEHARWNGENHALLLCWPPMSPMASECVEAFKGDTLIYIGEGMGGCCANDEFFQLVTGETRSGYDDDCEWIEGTAVDIPQWPGLHDYLTVYRR